MSTNSLDALWAELEKAQVDYESYCQTQAETEATSRKLANRVRELRTELGTFQDALPPCIACGGKQAQIVGPQVAGADPETVLGQYKILCAAREKDQTITLEDGSTQTIPGMKACRFTARGKTWAEALKRWDPVGAHSA